ncbi:low-affinity phosphate transporter, partial [Haplosporangium sp. Z 27]
MTFIKTKYSALWTDVQNRYSNLKKIIYQIEREIVAAGSDIEAGLPTRNSQPSETTRLLAPGAQSVTKYLANNTFLPALDKEVDKIVTFYFQKEHEVYAAVEALVSDAQNVESVEHTFHLRTDSSGEGHSRRASAAGSNKWTTSRRNSRANCRSLARSDGWSYDATLALANESSIQNSAHIASWDADNSTLGGPSQSEYEIPSASEITGTPTDMPHNPIDIKDNEDDDEHIRSLWFEPEMEESQTATKLQEQIDRVVGMYARIFGDDDVEASKRTLKMHLREHVVWGRNTIWRDMIGPERKSQAVTVSQSLGSKKAPVYLKTPLGNFQIPSFLTRDILVMAICLVVFVILLNVRLFEETEQQNCFAILIFASVLWATEAMPLFVTSLLVPLLVVMLRVMRSDDDDHARLGSQAATKKVFSLMFSPVIMLLLGGFAIAAAMSKFHIAKAMATVVLSRAGSRPSTMLLANMLVATLASMWISNVAAPVLCFSLIQPILRTLPPGSSFGKCLIIGIALASNVGGMASPISSPQNIIAIEYMSPAPSWFEWFFVAIPVCLVCDFVIAALLLWIYQPSSSTPTLSTIRSTKNPITKTQVFVCCVTIITIILWCFEHRLEWLFGDMGLIAIIPLVAFFGTGILTKEDFNNFLWTVIILAMGGIALGKAVESSGLLHTIAVHVQGYVEDMSAFQVSCVFASLVLVFATFISHTVGALIILPIVAQVGATLPEPHSRLLVMSSALMCSCAMGLPVSGFPNMNAIMMEDEDGQRYLDTMDFLKAGVPSSIVAFATITTLGYGLMSMLG